MNLVTMCPYTAGRNLPIAIHYRDHGVFDELLALARGVTHNMGGIPATDPATELETIYS